VIMSLKIIVVGDKTDHGGTVLGGSGRTTFAASPSHGSATRSIVRGMAKTGS